MTPIDALILGTVEGLTEFLPVSSTGHMILAAALLKLQNTDFLKSFEVAIQLGAILSVVLLYFKRFLQGPALYLRLFVAFLPTATIGFVLYKLIKGYLFNPLVVSLSLIVGGGVLILFDRWIESRPSLYSPEEMPLKQVAWVGLIQCLAMVPGVSRAGATILGGLFHGLDKKQATEFSFLLAVPTMLAATGYDLLKSYQSFSGQDFGVLILGGLVAFVSALLAIKLFIESVVRFGFRWFGWYRIVAGIGFLAYAYTFSLPMGG
ncbi:UDP-diphosphatase [bacterium (Candidatus Blackallbacteria) CG17_big_fil_post_rev_8_21_14_2_50_48_46]|uniref:Undecaprenyl-diphosphatase n=1 Tax=bacterium (Candidatus Blackallbacteria) CG17_big_fil_post_rev_8_21_14_2_50_48_46 TaxID=2014261 RepID=A0A2M7GB51_9BACT|nr:MAG: UDP-diphosphatase [bacterium (Candidatus Blackallbacteria) CG18_big_fil_WC_8_21_14_2_50_49_26]PIW19168.1 MAG: UDP-diphosphatase [bacterium (Candidatus Blackallbacteria) CG17_big_fil_post_rev_8_21_14_2_50_48_46]PIW45482.1 MAG: UDP-diphosphatase [bacterium (Candidatus Blackallbacteria) CG13_big_fil_rev_8_21_14_2_50_49_14]